MDLRCGRCGHVCYRRTGRAGSRDVVGPVRSASPDIHACGNWLRAADRPSSGEFGPDRLFPCDGPVSNCDRRRLGAVVLSRRHPVQPEHVALAARLVATTDMTAPVDLGASLLTSWRTNSRVTAYLVEHLPATLWDAQLPGTPRRTVRMILGHIHNSRCSWVKVLGREHGITASASVDRRTVARRELLSALKRSSKGIESLLE